MSLVRVRVRVGVRARARARVRVRVRVRVRRHGADVKAGRWPVGVSGQNLGGGVGADFAGGGDVGVGVRVRVGGVGGGVGGVGGGVGDVGSISGRFVASRQ